MFIIGKSISIKLPSILEFDNKLNLLLKFLKIIINKLLDYNINFNPRVGGYELFS